jgi:cytidyltransferase-like protein
MVDGSFDPLHDGHITYFREAHELGNLVLCNIAPESWTARKHPVLLSADKRALVLDAIKWIDFVHISQTSTVDVLLQARPKVYAKGLDWRERGLPKQEVEVCEALGVKIRFVGDQQNSSTLLVESLVRRSAK